MTAPDPILEAASQGVHDAACPCGDAWEACQNPDTYDWQAEGAILLAAVRPLIAEQIEELPYEQPAYSEAFAQGYRLAIADAARVARGDA